MPELSNCSDLVGRADNCFDDEATDLVVQDGTFVSSLCGIVLGVNVDRSLTHLAPFPQRNSGSSNATVVANLPNSMSSLSMPWNPKWVRPFPKTFMIAPKS
jgi:hypothetical protein